MADRGMRNILFHGVGTPIRELEPGEDRVWITVDRFHSILDEIARWPNCSISFDDGNISDIEIGLGALEQRRLTAKFFVLAGRLGEPGSRTESDLKELQSRGMKIGSHGMQHRSWRGMTASTRKAELVDARQRIEEAVGCAVTEAAAPFGSYDRHVLSNLRGLGYRAVYTSDGRLATTASWLQPRFSVRNDDTAESLRATVTSAESVGRRITLAAKGAAKRLR